MLRKATFVMAVVLLAVSLEAQPKLVNSNAPLVSVDRWKQALGGYDAVAYFDHGEARKGEGEFFTALNGVNYTFESKVTLGKFLAEPDDYLPQFGGYCALSLALADGELPERAPGLYRSDPTKFKIVDGKLYLFSSDLPFEALERWNEHESEYVARAEANWQAILDSRGSKK